MVPVLGITLCYLESLEPYAACRVRDASDRQRINGWNGCMFGYAERLVSVAAILEVCR
jgi:hypothetical protein